MVDFKFREVFFISVRVLTLFNLHLFRERFGICGRMEFGSIGFHFGFGSISGHVSGTRTAMLVRTGKDHKHRLAFTLFDIRIRVSQMYSFLVFHQDKVSSELGALAEVFSRVIQQYKKNYLFTSSEGDNSTLKDSICAKSSASPFIETENRVTVAVHRAGGCYQI
jgi:hypothetical protein